MSSKSFPSVQENAMSFNLSTLESGGKAASNSSSDNLHDSQKAAKHSDPNIVDFADGDLENPLNWGKGKKILAMALLASMGFAAAFSSTFVAPATGDLQRKWNLSSEVSKLHVSIMVLGWATGPLLFAPASEIWGRSIVYKSTWVLGAIFSIGAAFSPNIGVYLMTRFFAGMFTSPVMAMAPASVYDVYTMAEVGPPAFLVATLSLLGSVAGEATGGYVVQYTHDWKWNVRVLAIYISVLIAPIMFLPETHHNTILDKKAKRMRDHMGLPTLHTSYDNHSLPKAIIFRTAVFRPIQLLTREPIVWLCSTALAFVWGVLYLYLAAYLYIFLYTYKWEVGNAGAAFSGIGVGMILGVGAAPWANRTYLRLNEKHGNGKVFPEGRLPPAMVAMVLLPISMYWFAWTARVDIHWIVPVLSGVPYGIAQILLFMSLLSYMSDCFPTMTASVGAATSLFRLIFAAAFPLFAPSLYEPNKQVMANKWAGTMLASIAVVLAPIPFLFYRYGPYLRSKSRFTPKYL